MNVFACVVVLLTDSAFFVVPQLAKEEARVRARADRAPYIYRRVLVSPSLEKTKVVLSGNYGRTAVLSKTAAALAHEAMSRRGGTRGDQRLASLRRHLRTRSFPAFSAPVAGPRR